MAKDERLLKRFLKKEWCIGALIDRMVKKDILFFMSINETSSVILI